MGRGTVEELRPRIASGPLEVMRNSPGFLDYYAFDAGGGLVASVTVFETEEGLREAERLLEDWIVETMEVFDIAPDHLTEGSSLVSTRTT